jgi:fucose permease
VGLALGYLSDKTSTPFAIMLGAGLCLVLSIVIIAVPSILRGAASPGRR